MATKTFNEICVEYAHQLGKGLPLTPAEMCNAVIMYLNEQVEVMTGFVQTALNAVSDIQQDISEYPAPENIVSTNQNQNINSIKTFNGVQEFNDGINSNNGKIASGNICASDTGTYDGVNRVEIKPDGFISRISPAGTKNILLPDKDGELAVVNDIPNVPEIPHPTTSDNGKVLGVQSGAYALVEQSGGEAPANMVTTDTIQTISANKGFKSTIYSNKFLYTGNYSDDVLEKLLRDESITGDDANYNEFSADGMTCGMYRYTNGGTKLESVGMSLYEPASFSPSDYGNANVTFYVSCLEVEKYTNAAKSKTAKYQLEYPNKDGVIALISDIPDVDNFVTTNTEQTITATKTFSDIKVGLYELTSEGFEYSGANLFRYSASGREIRYGVSGYNSTVIGSNVKLNSDFNTSYINCSSNNIILGNSNTAINILGTSLTFNGADILTGSSGGRNYHLHNISLYTSSTESYLREAQLIITNTSSEPFTYDTLLNYLNGTNPRMCIGYANADSLNADVKTRNFIYKNAEYNYIAFCEVKTGDEFDAIKLTELENFDKNYTTVTDIVI